MRGRTACQARTIASLHSMSSAGIRFRVRRISVSQSPETLGPPEKSLPNKFGSSAELLPRNQRSKTRPSYPSSNPLNPAPQTRHLRNLRSPEKSPGLPGLWATEFRRETGNLVFAANYARKSRLSLRSPFSNLRDLPGFASPFDFASQRTAALVIVCPDLC